MRTQEEFICVYVVSFETGSKKEKQEKALFSGWHSWWVHFIMLWYLETGYSTCGIYIYHFHSLSASTCVYVCVCKQGHPSPKLWEQSYYTACCHVKSSICKSNTPKLTFVESNKIPMVKIFSSRGRKFFLICDFQGYNLGLQNCTLTKVLV